MDGGRLGPPSLLAPILPRCADLGHGLIVTKKANDEWWKATFSLNLGSHRNSRMIGEEMLLSNRLIREVAVIEALSRASCKPLSVILFQTSRITPCYSCIVLCTKCSF